MDDTARPDTGSNPDDRPKSRRSVKAALDTPAHRTPKRVAAPAETPTSERAQQRADRSSARGAKMAVTRARKMAELFQDQQWKVLAEVHLGPNEQFLTPFGNRGRHGYVLRNLASGVRIFVGETVLRQAITEFNAVPGAPPARPKRKRRTREQKQADEARQAAVRMAANDAILARLDAGKPPRA
jgi:hypothetical protein